jgi:hypothetical protein
VVPAGEAATVEADLDGDGVREVVTLTRSEQGDAVLWAETAGGPLAVGVTKGFTPAPGVSDVNGDGQDEVVIPASLSTRGLAAVQVWGVRDCRWVPVTVGDDPAPARLAYSSWRSGAERQDCEFGDDPRLTNRFWSGYAVSGERPDVYEVRTTVYRWVGLRLEQVGPSTVTEVGRDGLPAFQTEFACGQPTEARPAPGPAPTTTAPRPTPPTPMAPPRSVRATPTFTG